MLFNPKKYRHLPETNIIGNNSDVDHIYYNIILFNDSSNYDKNGNPIPTVLSVPANFSQQRADDFISKPSDYKVSVTYFHIDSNSFPSQIVFPKVGTVYKDPTTAGDFTIEGVETIYSVTLEVTYSVRRFPFQRTARLVVPIYWKPLDGTLQKPSFPITSDELTNEYFWNYSFDYFLDLVNNSIGYAMESLYTSTGATYSSQKPYFILDGATNLISLNAPLSFITDIEGNATSDLPNWKIFVNEPLYQLIQGAEALYTETFQYQLLVIPSGDASNVIPQYNSFTLPPVPPVTAPVDTPVDAPIPMSAPSAPLVLTQTSNYIQMTQQFSSTYLWNPVVSIVFTTPNFNVVKELQANPYVEGLNPNPKVNNAGVLNILFEYFLGRRADPIINNFVKAEYRLTSLQGIQPESEFQMNTYWKDEFGDLHPFFIEQGCGLNMKILFRKKNI